MTPAARLRLVQRWVVATRAVARRDAVLVTVMAIVMALSAFSVHQATRASDQAADRLTQHRVLQSEAVRTSGYVQTLVDHDLAVLQSYCRAAIDRDVSRVSLLSNEPDVSALVSATLTTDALRPLLQGDRSARCPQASNEVETPSYSVPRAQQFALQSWRGLLPGERGASELAAEAQQLSVREISLMWAGLLFALTLAGLITVEALGNGSARPQRLGHQMVGRLHSWVLAVCAVVSLAAGVLLVVNVVDLAFLALLIGLLLSVLVARVRARPPARGGGRGRPTAVGRPHWWAEVVGAFTLVAFSSAAVGLSYVSVQERDERASSDRRSAAAQELQQAGQQAALRDLAAVSLMAELEAQWIAAEQAAAVRGDDEEYGGTGGAAVFEVRTELDGELQALEESVREQFAGTASSGMARDCPSPLDTEVQPPAQLYEQLGDDPAAISSYVLATQEAARACDVSSALARHAATVWARHGSTFAVSLVLLGLAGFLLSLASDPDRSPRSARTLLGIGGGGTAVGLALGLLTVPDIFWRANLGDNAEIEEFSRAVAGAHQDPCGALERLDEAINAFDVYGPVFEARAYARFCAATPLSEAAVITSELDPRQVGPIMNDMRRALDLGPRTPSLVGDLGWMHLLRGIQQQPAGREDLEKGLVLTSSAVQEMESRPHPSGQGLHVLRLNQALAYVALGHTEEALTAYAEAVRCLDPVEACEGGGLLDPDLRDSVLLAALADLELIEGDLVLDAYRHAILGGHRATAAAHDWSRAEVGVFPQEVQLGLTSEDALPEVVVIWYQRPDETARWRVLREPSLTTLHPGQHANRPIATSQLLPDGQYRADVYAGETRTVLSTDYTAEHELVRHRSRTLGVSVATPPDWVTHSDDGIEWHVGPTESEGVTIRRLEHVWPDTDVVAYVEQELGEWVTRRWGDDLAEPETDSEAWFLGLHDPVFQERHDLNIMAAGGLAPVANNPYCGGALLMATVGGGDIDPALIARVYDSIVLERPQVTLPHLEGTVETDGFTIDVPDGWQAAVRPAGGTGASFSAKDCYSGANVLVSRADIARGWSLRSEIDSTLEILRTDFPEFVLEEERSVDVSGSDEAVELRFTWASDGRRVFQRQVHARDEEEHVFMTVTTYPEGEEIHDETFGELIGSLRLQPDAADTP